MLNIPLLRFHFYCENLYFFMISFISFDFNYLKNSFDFDNSVDLKFIIVLASLISGFALWKSLFSFNSLWFMKWGKTFLKVYLALAYHLLCHSRRKKIPTTIT